MLRQIKLRIRALIPPAIFLAITWYFAWNALHGARGLEAQRAEHADLLRAAQSYMAIDAARTRWETQVADLNSRSVAPDMLDQQSRTVLNLADPGDLVLQLPAAAK